MENDFEKEILSGEEVRELLRDDFPEEGASFDAPASSPAERKSRPAAASSAAPPPQVLLVARRGGGSELLRGRLEVAGARVSAVRNPFSALDHLRSFPVDAIITELNLWAEDGALLFERVRALGKEVPILFLAEPIHDTSGDLEERALRAGAWKVLFSPLQAGEVEESVRGLLRAAPDRSSSHPARADVAAQADVGVPCGALRAPPERERRDPSPSPPFQGPSFQDDLQNDLQNDLQDEVRWLRLFHRFSRTLRLFEEKSALLKEIVSAAREELDAQAAGIFYRGDGQPLAILAGRTGTRFEDLISMAAASAREAGSLKISFGGAAGSAGAPGGQGEKGCMILFGLSPGSLRAAGPMVPDVQDLLGRIGSPARP